VILAIDAATKTGWALIREGRVYESGVQDFSKRRGDKIQCPAKDDGLNMQTGQNRADREDETKDRQGTP
jgi:hypothetical protein